MIIGLLTMAVSAMAQGWPERYGGVMLQAFYWDSFSDTQWTALERQADDLAATFSLVWIPQSGNCGTTSMGYDDLWWFNDYNSSFGSEQQLRAMIQTMKAKGVGVIADVVVNHRRNVSNWVDFPKESYQGVTYEMTAADICADDDDGATLSWARNNGYELSANNDTGEGWSGMRDLDHKSLNVQNTVKAYLLFLLNDLGYSGFRYDMVKGYGAEFTKMYNETAQPTFSVGECWDGNTVIRNWIDGTGKTSAAFDFPFRYTVRNAINKQDWSQLSQQDGGSWPIISKETADGAYRRYAVTFVENHDTERRANAAQDPLVRDTLAANAYLLAMPGTPCVFMKHWQAYRQEIRAMVEARRLAGIHNESNVTQTVNSKSCYGVTTEGTAGKLLALVGTAATTYRPATTWVRILSGHHYAYYLDRGMNTVWASLPSGTYEGTQSVRLVAVSDDSDAKLVYTLDGTAPTAQSTVADSGTEIDLPAGQTILTVGLLTGGTVKGITTRSYNVKAVAPFEPYDITVYVNADRVGWSTVNFWTWGGDGSHSPKKTSWPGDQVTQTTTVGQRQWMAQQYRINSATDEVNFVFSTNSGSPQTVDVNGINKTSFFEVSATMSNGKHLVDDVTSQYDAGIGTLMAADAAQQPLRIYTTDGRLVGCWPVGTTEAEAMLLLRPNVYVVNGKKIIK